MPKYRDMEERLLVNSYEVPGIPGSPCWRWLGPRDAQGKYGHISVWIRGRGSVHRMAHRVSRAVFLGKPVPDDMQLDHRVDLGCIGGLCIHPNHTDEVTNEENTRLRDERRRQREPGEEG